MGTEGFIFRTIRQDEMDQALRIEHQCFPPNEACSERHMKQRILEAQELFFVVEDPESEQIVGFLNGIATEEACFRDEFFTDASIHDPNGRNIMLLSLAVLPEYQMRGLARALVSHYLEHAQQEGRKKVFLTCLDEKVAMYQKFGFQDLGMADSAWGGEAWHEMYVDLG